MTADIVARHEDQLAELAVSCARDSLRLVKMGYPWGESGGLLADLPLGLDDCSILLS